MKKSENKSANELLRKKAEDLVNKTESLSTYQNLEIDHLKLIHELQVHQIELQMQNEELVLAKQQAETAQKKYIELYDFAPTGYLTLSTSGEITKLNLYAAQLLGKERSRLINNRFAFFISNGSKRIFSLFFEKAFKDKSKQTCDVTLSFKGKPEIFVQLSGIVTEPSEELLVAMVDITERKLAENALYESEMRFRQMADTAPVLIWQSGTDALCNYFNKGWLDFTGRTFEQEYGNGWAEGVHPDDFDRCLNIYLTSFNTRQPFTMEYRLRRSDGEYRWLVDNGIPRFSEEGVFLGFIGSCVEITDRIKAEEEIKTKNEQLTKLNIDKNKFFSIIAHDLSSPFHNFLGITEILADKTSDCSKEEIISMSNDLNRIAGNLYKLLKNLLDWAQVQKGMINFKPKEISLSNCVSENIETLGVRIEQKGLVLINHVLSHFQVYADENMLNSIVMNLLSNATKFTKRGGLITVSAKETSDNMVEVSVSDTGVGINKNIIDKLFIIGEKTGSKGTEGELSTGLGLLLCKEFIELNGGKIWAESQQNEGSSFFFTLKLA